MAAFVGFLLQSAPTSIKGRKSRIISRCKSFALSGLAYFLFLVVSRLLLPIATPAIGQVLPFEEIPWKPTINFDGTRAQMFKIVIAGDTVSTASPVTPGTIIHVQLCPGFPVPGKHQFQWPASFNASPSIFDIPSATDKNIGVCKINSFAYDGAIWQKIDSAADGPQVDRQFRGIIRGSVNALLDCGLKGDGVSDESVTLDACIKNNQGSTIIFPRTQPLGKPSYFFGKLPLSELPLNYTQDTAIIPRGAGTVLRGEAAGWLQGLKGQLAFGPGITGILLDGSLCEGCSIEHLSLQGGDPSSGNFDPTNFIIPKGSSLTSFNRLIKEISRTTNVLKVTIFADGGVDGLAQREGSTVKITLPLPQETYSKPGLLPPSTPFDGTMNGLCVITKIDPVNGGAGTQSFECGQDGPQSPSGQQMQPFSSAAECYPKDPNSMVACIGVVELPTGGPSKADGIHVCSDFVSIYRVFVQGFGRHGINLDSSLASGCPGPTPTDHQSDDFLISGSMVVGNQADGIYCRGGNCNGGTVRDTALYTNGLWGGEDQGFLGNTWEANQASYNGSTQNPECVVDPKLPPGSPLVLNPRLNIPPSIVGQIKTIARDKGKVTITWSGPIDIKLGQAIVVEGLTGATSDFNTPAGSAYFVTEISEDQMYLSYVQPGAPSDVLPPVPVTIQPVEPAHKCDPAPGALPLTTRGGVRVATFPEAYKAAGVDSGAYKIGTGSPVQSYISINNYSEQPQVCKYGASTGIVIGGSNINLGTGGCLVDPLLKNDPLYPPAIIDLGGRSIFKGYVQSPAFRTGPDVAGQVQFVAACPTNTSPGGSCTCPGSGTCTWERPFTQGSYKGWPTCVASDTAGDPVQVQVRVVLNLPFPKPADFVLSLTGTTDHYINYICMGPA